NVIRDDVRAEWNGILAVAEAGSGNRAEAVRAAELAGRITGRTPNPWRVAGTELAQSEVALAAGEWPRALENAKSAAAWAAAVGNAEMEWRCWGLSARAA